MGENDLIRQFVQEATAALGPYLDEYGVLLYSSVDSLRTNNPIVYWGFNPGGDRERGHETNWTIREAISRFPSQTKSLLDDQVWPPCRIMGQAPYQRGVKHLLSFIGHPEALVTNFLFFQTVNAQQCRLGQEQISACWKVHRFLSKKIGAKLILTTQGVVSELRRHCLMCLNEVKEGRIRSEYSNWPCVLYENVKDDDLKGLFVLAAPHMSYWGGGIEQDDYTLAKTWIKAKVDAVLAKSAS